MFSRASNDFPQRLNPTSHQQNDQDQEDHTYPAAGAVSPARTIRPRWQRANKEQDQDDEKYGAHMSPPFKNVFDTLQSTQLLTIL